MARTIEILKKIALDLSEGRICEEKDLSVGTSSMNLEEENKNVW